MIPNGEKREFDPMMDLICPAVGVLLAGWLLAMLAQLLG